MEPGQAGQLAMVSDGLGVAFGVGGAEEGELASTTGSGVHVGKPAGRTAAGAAAAAAAAGGGDASDESWEPGMVDPGTSWDRTGPRIGSPTR